MDLFLQNLPKIELHAHLNGSLNTTSIQELGLQLYGANNTQFLELCKQFTDFNDANLEDAFKKFAFMHDLTSTRKGLQLACEMVIRDFIKDKVIYLELRTTPKENQNMTRREYIGIVIEAIQNYKVNDIMVKLIISIDRSQSIEVAEEIVQLSLEFTKKYPNIVKGVDLSGNPNKGHFSDFKHLLEMVKNDDQLKLALHCAEVLNDSETQEMLDFGFNRCGHGTFLTEKQLQQCLELNITIECCLTSNVKCATVKSYKCHHFKNMFENKNKVVLCTDDSGVFDTTLTEEFIKAYTYFNLNKENIYTLSLNAIQASFAEDSEKLILKQEIDNYFKN